LRSSVLVISHRRRQHVANTPLGATLAALAAAPISLRSSFLMSVLPTTQQRRLATLHAPACQRYYASRLAAESPHPSTFDLPRGIFRPSTTGTKMLVKRAWTYEDVAADPDTFELVRHPSREPFTLPVWVQHALRTILAAQGPAARLAKARPLCADPHGATVCQGVRRPACGLARAGGMEVWHYHAQRSAVPPHATQLVEGSRLLVLQLGSPARWSANRVPRDRTSEASGGAALQALPPPVPAAGPFVGGPARPLSLHSARPKLRSPLAQALLPRRRPLRNEGAVMRARRSAAHAQAIGGGLAIGGARQGA
jgi:hypothetical protein